MKTEEWETYYVIIKDDAIVRFFQIPDDNNDYLTDVVDYTNSH